MGEKILIESIRYTNIYNQLTKSKLACLMFLLSILSYSQGKENIYMVYVGGAGGTCLSSIYRNGQHKQEMPFTYKFFGGYFVICERYFQVKSHSEIGEITEEEAKHLHIVKIDYLLRKRERTKETQLGDPNNLFNKIYILMPHKSDKYLRFEVRWEDLVPAE